MNSNKNNNNNNLKISKQDIKDVSEDILNDFLSTSKKIFFKYILGIFIKEVCKRKNINIKDLTNINEDNKKYNDVMNILLNSIEPILKDELQFVINKLNKKEN